MEKKMRKMRKEKLNKKIGAEMSLNTMKHKLKNESKQ